MVSYLHTQAAEGATQAKVDVVADRRRAKALKVPSRVDVCHSPISYALSYCHIVSHLVQLLDAKMAELAQEPEGWDDVVRTVQHNSLSPATTHIAPSLTCTYHHTGSDGRPGVAVDEVLGGAQQAQSVAVRRVFLRIQAS